MGTIIMMVAHTGWHWMLERGAVLDRSSRPAQAGEVVAARGLLKRPAGDPQNCGSRVR
jgi:hypothetical protein